jgi:hypothetical protein
MSVECVVKDKVLGIVLVVVISTILSVFLAFFIDTNHRFMTGYSPEGCPSAFLTPLFYITLALTLPLMIVVGITILNARESSSRVYASRPNRPGDQLEQ